MWQTFSDPCTCTTNNRVWFAYIVTRPLGASFADWMGVPKNLGGLDIGRGVVSLGLAAYVTATHEDSPAKAEQ